MNRLKRSTSLPLNDPPIPLKKFRASKSFNDTAFAPFPLSNSQFNNWTSPPLSLNLALLKILMARQMAKKRRKKRKRNRRRRRNISPLPSQITWTSQWRYCKGWINTNCIQWWPDPGQHWCTQARGVVSHWLGFIIWWILWENVGLYNQWSLTK